MIIIEIDRLMRLRMIRKVPILLLDFKFSYLLLMKLIKLKKD